MQLFFLGIFSFFRDMAFIIKLFAFIAILGFANKYIQNKVIKTIVILFMGYFVLIANWAVFGTLYVVYTLLGLGIAGVFVDFFFVGQGEVGHKQMEEMQEKNNPTPISSGIDMARSRMNPNVVKNINPFAMKRGGR